MKKIFQLILLSGLLSSFAFAQTKMPARQVTVSTTNFGYVVSITNEASAQSVFDSFDSGLNDLSNDVADRLPGTNIVGATYADSQWTVNAQTPTNVLPGTNVVGATYANNQWTINTSAFITGIIFEVSGDTSYSSTVSSGLATIYYPTNSP